MALLELREAGFYCAPGEFYIDPWAGVDRAVVTHAHSDHARPGSRAYLTTPAGEALLRQRVGDEPAIQALRYGEPVILGDVTVSLHPAGHILGSAQVRMEHRGEIWVLSGDYKLAPDPTCAPFEPVRCHTFVTESTFALPIFRWADEASTMAEIHSWWRANQQASKASALFAYPLGKAQRILAAIDPSIGPVFCHGAVERINAIYRGEGIALPLSVETTESAKTTEAAKTDWSKALILAPPSAQRSPWMRRFGSVSTAFASGWMRIRGARRRRSLDRGFVLSDHADWPGLLTAIAQTGAETVWVTHGYRAPLARWLEEHGRHAVDVGELAGQTGAEADTEPDTKVDWE